MVIASCITKLARVIQRAAVDLLTCAPLIVLT